MIEVQASTVVDAPSDKVWEYMSDLGKMTEWDPGTLKVEWHPPISVGSVAIVTAQVFGKREVNWEVTEWEPGHKIGCRVNSGGTIVKATYTLEPVEGGSRTKLSRWASVEVGGLLRLISPLAARKTRNERSAEIENIKRIVERQQKEG